MRGSVMTLTAAGGGFVVFLLSMPVIQGQSDWGVTYTPTQICALQGSTVEIHCTYKYPSTTNPTATVEQTIWFTRGSRRESVDLKIDSQYSGRVQYICGNNNCTLRITDLRRRDSAEYKFRFITNQEGGSYTGSPGVTLSVTDLQVQVSRLGVYKDPSYIWAELRCQSICHLSDNSSYIWYKNGQKIQEETSSYSGYIHPAESYACALKGHDGFPSRSECVHGPSCNTVLYTQRSLCVLTGSSVDIYCIYNSYETITSKFWFSPERSHQWEDPSQPEDLSEDSQYASRVQVRGIGSGSVLRITDLRESDSGDYHFKFKTKNFEWRSSLPGTTLTVTDPDLQVLVRPSSPSWVYLRCFSSCYLPNGISFIWYKNGQVIREGTSYYSDDLNAAHSYSCALKGREDFPSPSVCTRGQSCNRVTYSERRICASRGSSVNISCTYNSYNDHVGSKFWFSPRSPSSPPEDLNEDFQYAGRVQVLETERRRSTLRITDLTESDSVEYRFKFIAGSFEWRSSLPGTTLTVTALHVQVVRLTVHQSHTEAELKCLSSCSPAGRLSYVWFRNREKVVREESSYTDWIYPGDVISCALKGHEAYRSPSVYALKVPSVSVSPSGEIMEGKAVTLTCSIDASSAANYTWYKDEVNIKVLNKDPQLVFRSIQSSDSGEYYCTAENELGRRTSEYTFIHVKYAPKTCSVSVSPSGEIVEGSSVNLTCSSDANPAAKYTWYKDNQTLILRPEGCFRFTSISSEDRGTYHCRSENQHGQLDSTSVFIDVKYAPHLPSVSVSPSAEMVEGSSVTLTCSSDANPAANYTWYKENEDSPKASGQNFTITDFRAEHSGNYYCEAQNRRGRHNSTLHLIVVAGPSRSAAAGITTVVLLSVILPAVFIFYRKKTAFKRSSEPREQPDNREQYLPMQRQLDDQQDDLHYASIQFFKNQADPLYSNIRPAQPLRRREEEDESVEYAVVKFNSRRTAPR